MIWRVLKLFPQTLPYTDIRDIPETEFYWLATQSLIDDKFNTCPECSHLQNQGEYCIECGASMSGTNYNPEHYVCGECNHYHLPDDAFCRFCGANVASDLYTKYQKELDERSKTENIADVGAEIANKLQSMCETVPKTWIDKLNLPEDEFMQSVYGLLYSNAELQKQMNRELEKVQSKAKEQES
jgi:methionyl-tRNA synthetase